MFLTKPTSYVPDWSNFLNYRKNEKGKEFETD